MSFYYGSQQHHPQHSAMHSHPPHHSGRSRRQARASGSHNNNNNNNHHHRQLRALRLQKEAEESAMEKAFRRDFEAARSFDFEDDELFCPFNLLTDDDVSTPACGCHQNSILGRGLQY